eukprot:1384188-Amorphochlora_amoeboformis.AAC.2
MHKIYFKIQHIGLRIPRRKCKASASGTVSLVLLRFPTASDENILARRYGGMPLVRGTNASITSEVNLCLREDGIRL